LKLGLHRQLRSDRARVVAQPLDRRFAAVPQHVVEPLFDFRPRKRARHADPRPRRAHVFKKRSGRRSDPEIADERPVARERRRAFARPQRHTGQNDVALVVGDQKD